MADSIALAEREDLNDLLLEMCRYGKPSVGMLNLGWACSVDMHVAAVGTNFRVESDFGHQTPIAAAKQCHARILATVKQLEAIAK